ncbi:MAG: elongation factor G, partial [Bauldia litoralis]
EYLGDRWTFIDCPGSVEFLQDARHGLMVCDVAVVVAEPTPEKAMMLVSVFKFLDDYEIPHILFVNKVDHASEVDVPSLLAAMQEASDRPLVLRQLPIRDGDAITGYVDLASERAYSYKPGEPSDLITVPSEVADQEEVARQEMLESVADFDDALLEKLLEDVVPARDEVYAYLTDAAQADKIVPVLIGSATNDHGVRRLLKALRHETAGPAKAAARNELEPSGEPLATVFKSLYMQHTGKLSVARVWSGAFTDGMTIDGHRVSGLHRLKGHEQEKIARAGPGEVVALGRLDEVHTGELLTTAGAARGKVWPTPALPLFSLAIDAARREDEVKLTAALGKLIEEDPSLHLSHNPDTGEMVLSGQGEIHIKVAIDRLKSKFNLDVTGRRPQVAYKETIRKPISQHARHKKQSGGHGQFGDVHIDIKPLPRGSGFAFQDTIHGGSVPKQYIPAVEKGVKDYLQRGPLGFPVVDVAVTLTDGSAHSVDSSDQAFATAGALAMREGMPKCEPVLLEPVYDVKISAPNHFTSNIQGLISGRRGQILGFDAKPGWRGWDEVTAKLPESEVQDLIIELRSLTQGVGTFEHAFDHLQEFTGRQAEQVVEARANGQGHSGQAA